MNISKYITIQNHHEGFIFPDTFISFGLLYPDGKYSKPYGVYFKVVLSEIKIKKHISFSTFSNTLGKCKHHYLFHLLRRKSKFEFIKYNGWFPI